MSKKGWPADYRPDEPRGTELYDQVECLDRDLEQEFWFAVGRMEQDKILKIDGNEVLNGRFQTYAIPLGNHGVLLLADFDTGAGQWHLLALVVLPGAQPDRIDPSCSDFPTVDPYDVGDRLYQECCAAHGLANPHRQPI